jgi:hypothetical protein
VGLEAADFKHELPKMDGEELTNIFEVVHNLFPLFLAVLMLIF